MYARIRTSSNTLTITNFICQYYKCYMPSERVITGFKFAFMGFKLKYCTVIIIQAEA